VQGEYSLGDLSVRFGLGLRGEPSLRISRVATLSHAEAGALSFLANQRVPQQMESTRATAVLVGPEPCGRGCPVAALIDPNPYLAYARIAELPASSGAIRRRELTRRRWCRLSARNSGFRRTWGRWPSSRMTWSSAERVVVGPGCIVQKGAQIGADSRLVSRVKSICRSAHRSALYSSLRSGGRRRRLRFRGRWRGRG